MKSNHFLRSSFQYAMTFSLITLLFCLSTSKQLNAQATISLWTYEPVQNTNANPTPNTGAGSSAIVGSMTGISTATGINTLTGCGSQTSGTTAWAIGTANPGVSNESSGGQFNVSTVGHTNIIFQWEQRWSATATNTLRLQYTTNGTTWNNFTMDALNTTFCLGSLNNGRFETNTTTDQFRRIRVDLSSIIAANNNANFGVRIVAAHYQATGQFRQVVNTATVATGGTWRFDNVIVLGTPSTSTVIVTPGAFNGAFGNIVVGNSSASSSYTVEGVNLTGNIIITPPAGGFEIRTGVNAFSTATINLTPVSGTVALTTIDVRFTPAAPGAVGGVITNASALATTINVPVSGTGIAPVVPTKLRVVSVNNGSPVLVDQSFSVQLESADISNIPQNVATNTFVQLSINIGSGPLGGTIGGTITAGTNSLSITGITYGTGETGVVLDATAISGDVLTPASTNPFNVLDTAQVFTFNNVPATAVINTVLTSFTVQARRPDNTIDINYTGSITISKGSGTGNMTGTLTKTASFGVATFNDIQFDQLGAYSIQADDGAIPTATSSTIFITGVPVLTELVVPKYFGSKTSASGNDNRTPVSLCLQIDNLIPLATYDVRAALALSSEANTVLGAGNIWNGSAFNLQDVPGAFTTDINGSSGPFWIHIQPTGNSARFDAGQTHTVRLNYVPTGNTLNNTVKLAGSKILTALDIAPTARTVSTADDGAFIYGSADGCNSGQYVLVYDNESGTGDPLFAYPAASTILAQSATNGAQLPAAINSFYQQVGVVAGDFVAVVPIGANNPNGVRRVEARNTDNTVANFSSDADGVWPSGANTTTNTRRSVTTLLNTDAPVEPSVVITGGETICAGGSSDLTLTFTGIGPFTYSINGGAPVVASGNPEIVSVSPLTTTLYTVTSLLNATCTGTSTGSANIVVNTTPPTGSCTINPTPVSGCVGDNVVVTTNVVAGATGYTWSTPAGTLINGQASPVTTVGNSVTITLGTLAANSSGWQICAFAFNSCGQTNTNCKFIRGALSSPAAISGSTVACPSTPGSYSTLPVGGASSYVWSITGDASVSGTGTTGSVSFGSTFTSGSLCVRALLPCGYQGPQRCMTISNGTPLLGVMSGTFTVCPGTNGVAYSVPPSAGAASYNWVVPTGAAIATGTGTNSITVNFGLAYTGGNICVTATSICGVNSLQRCKTIASNKPGTPGNISGTANGVCGQTITYTISNVPGATGYTWSAPAGASLGSANGNNSIDIIYPANFTTGQLCVTADNACGSSVARCIIIKGTPSNPGSISGLASVCANDAGLVYSISPVFGATGYVWITPSGTSIVSGQGTTTLTLDWGANGGVIGVTATGVCGVSGTRTLNVTMNCRVAATEIPGTIINAYPNPVNALLNIELNSIHPESYTVVLMDFTGRVIYTDVINAIEGVNTTSLNVANFAKGVYTLSVKNSEEFAKQIRVVVE